MFSLLGFLFCGGALLFQWAKEDQSIKKAIKMFALYFLGLQLVYWTIILICTSFISDYYEAKFLGDLIYSILFATALSAFTIYGIVGSYLLNKKNREFLRRYEEEKIKKIEN